MLTITWDNHNRIIQADTLHAYDDGDTGREEGQQTVVEWRMGPASDGPWGEPTTSIVTAPNVATFDPPSDGWVQITVYSIRDGVTSWQSHVGVVYAVGGLPYAPGNRITDAGDNRITDAGDTRITE